MSAFWLKLLACASMFLDHYGAVLHPRVYWLRIFGRLAFPCYAFLIANGFRYTRNRRRYLIRLLIFALLSEIPFDLTFFQSMGRHFQHQNVFLTLTLGLAALMLNDYLQQRLSGNGASGKTAASFYLRTLASLFAVGGMALLADLLQSDYGSMGVLCVYVFHLWDQRQISFPVTILLIGVLNLLLGFIQLYALFALLPLAFYNSQPGPRNRWIQYGFYLFYPIHLLVLHFASIS